MTHKRIIALIAAGILSFTIVGCGSPANDNGHTKASSEAEDIHAEKTVDVKDTVKFGETATNEAGFSVTMSEPEEFEPSDHALYDMEGTPLKVHVTFDNGTKEEVNSILVAMTVQSGGEEGEEIYDTENKLGEIHNEHIEPGTSYEFDFGFTVPDPDDITIEIVSSDWPESKLTVTNK